MSESQENHASGTPIRTIHEAYRRCLTARDEYYRVRNEEPSLQTVYHRELQNAVQSYFEALYEHLSTEDAAEDYWEGSKDAYLWSRERFYITTDEGKVPAETLPKDQLAEIDLEKHAEKRTEYVGLQALKNEFDNTETVDQDISTAYGKFTKTRKQPNLIPVATLFRAARLLNQAAKDLGFLPSGAPPDETDPAPV